VGDHRSFWFCKQPGRNCSKPKERSQSLVYEGEIVRSHAVFSLLHIAGALGVAIVWIAIFSLLCEPARHKLSAIMIAGAGAAYLSGGLGVWELVACAAFTVVAYKGLDDYLFIGLGWVMHSCWDVVHVFYGHPIIPFAPNSSAGCAVCDLLLAAWYFKGARPFFGASGMLKSEEKFTGD
jgi:Family of unknown function (DUF6010)